MLTKTNYVAEAEKAIMNLERNEKSRDREIKLTTNQIRNVLSLMSELYDMVRTETSPILNDDIVGQIQYNKMKLIYMAGREATVKDLLTKSQLVAHMDEIGNKREQLIIVCRYAEALVAYHKYNAKN